MMRWLLFFASLPLIVCPAVQDVNSDSPDKGFVRRAYHSSAMINSNTLIVDGGEIVQLIGPKQVNTNLPMNVTLSIDMSRSWDASNVPWTAINKTGSYPMNNQILWPSSDGKTCYAFGGESSTLWYLENLNPTYSPRPVDLYQFTLDDYSGGSWTTIEAPSYRSADQSSVFQPLLRPSKALGALVDNTGFIIGGVSDYWSQTGLGHLDGSVPIPGIASYNMTNSQWSNDTTPTNVANTFLIGVPSFGPSGLLISSGSSGIGSTSQSLNNLTIYEPIGKTWHVQTTTGQAPDIRSQPCTVGIQGDNGTYEIFLYGGSIIVDDSATLTGAQEAANTNLDEVWVLSLPAFAWFKAVYEPQQSRYKHTCHVVGKRQMISIGGDNINDRNDGILSVDKERQGLGIFDMTMMVWNDGNASYSASAAPYVSPAVVKSWYSENTIPQFSDSAVSGFFKGSNTHSSSSQSTSLPAQPTATPTSHSNTGAIAGGVVGGIVLLAIIAGLLWYFFVFRRRKQHHHQVPQDDDHHHHGEVSQGAQAGAAGGVGVDAKAELDAERKWYELPSGGKGQSNKAKAVSEMEATQKTPETGPFEVGEAR